MFSFKSLKKKSNNKAFNEIELRRFCVKIVCGERGFFHEAPYEIDRLYHYISTGEWD